MNRIQLREELYEAFVDRSADYADIISMPVDELASHIESECKRLPDDYTAMGKWGGLTPHQAAELVIEQAKVEMWALKAKALEEVQ